ncbi:Protein kinase-like (PK-like) [Glarea lozoyensis ATCC 20868]|uniref:Protein kinase-like (PK-like) n=1 Tax=Glarea lozoyensis (strain ATCC 20868 / MF5171) TaxID=1116229 RepID=S3DDS0_GLAL2|nr:Protein kinase-like (PK-like) [Glarea lozoyensis ATCC 20868]EPE30136.1 Protein kinase-like (PK-like) [Glarea lozoyensis ATCC 20868]
MPPPIPQAEPNRTPRARYNYHFLSRLTKLLNDDGECDLSEQLQKYKSSRLQALRGSATPPSIPIEPAKAPEPCISEPAGELSIVIPLSPQIETLLKIPHGKQPHEELSTTFFSFLRKGDILHRGIHDSRWVIKISEDIIVKCGPNVDVREIQTLNYLSPFKKQILCPEPHGAISVGRWTYLFMSYIAGTPLSKPWPALSPSQKTSVQRQLDTVFKCLRSIPAQSELFGSGTPPRCKDLRTSLRIADKPISNEEEFNSFLVHTNRERNPIYLNLISSGLSINHRAVMTHSDLHPGNLLARLDYNGGIEVTGIIDWEMSGFYPEYWEYIKAHSYVHYDVSDWYSYLPTDAIGNYGDEWRRDCLVTRLTM